MALVGVLRGGKLAGKAGRVVSFGPGYSTVTLATTRGFSQVGGDRARKGLHAPSDMVLTHCLCPCKDSVGGLCMGRHGPDTRMRA